MDERQRHYRKGQLEVIAGGQDYMAKLKLSSIGGETNWLNITDEEVEGIKKVLTGINLDEFINYKIESRNNYYGVDQYKGKSCQRCVFTGSKKQAVEVMGLLDNAIRETVHALTGIRLKINTEGR